jgi:DNA polymerase sigma
MKELFEEQPSLKVVSLVLKELLRTYELNKPFTGGIGSFALVILAYNILSCERAEKGADLAHQLTTICSFMVDKFEPYHTLITANRNTVLRANPKQELNIEDPHENTLLNTARIRQMAQILELLRAFRELLRDIEQELLALAPEERKKMKRVFFEKWDSLFKPEHWPLQKRA